MKWMLSTDSDYEKILNKNPEKAIENYDDLRAFENRCLMIFWVGSYGFAQGGGGFAVVGDWTIDGIAGKYEKGIYSSGCQDSANSAVFCRKNATVGTVAHELGHAFGLPHPNLNDTNWCLSVMGCGWDFPANQLLNTSINPEKSILLSNPFFQVKG